MKKEQRKVIFFVDLASAYDRVRRCDVIDMIDEAVGSGRLCADCRAALAMTTQLLRTTDVYYGTKEGS